MCRGWVRTAPQWLRFGSGLGPWLHVTPTFSSFKKVRKEGMCEGDQWLRKYSDSNVYLWKSSGVEMSSSIKYEYSNKIPKICIINISLLHSFLQVLFLLRICVACGPPCVCRSICQTHQTADVQLDGFDSPPVSYGASSSNSHQPHFPSLILHLRLKDFISHRRSSLKRTRSAFARSSTVSTKAADWYIVEKLCIFACHV